MASRNPKPIRLFIIRHGESEANVNLAIYETKPDSGIDLTPRGWDQALNCGAQLLKFLEENAPKGDVVIWHSSYNRARQTAQGIHESIGLLVSDVRDADFLVEQHFGLADGLTDEQLREQFPLHADRMTMFRANNDRHFIAHPEGESRADVAMRCAILFGNIHRAHQQGVTDFVIVTHGATTRAFFKEWLRIRHEDMLAEFNPGNCDVRLIDSMKDMGYILKNGILQPPKEIIHKSAAEYLREGAYFPPFAQRPAGLVDATGQPVTSDATRHLG